jgi:hypothetical protein
MQIDGQIQPAGGGGDDPIVGRDYIAAAVQAAAETEPAGEQELIAGEPLLSAYLRDGSLQILGKLALAGAVPPLIENVAEDYFRLLRVAVEATRDAYRALLADLLPDDGADEPGGT